MKKMLIALLTAASLHATAQTEGNKTLLPEKTADTLQLINPKLAPLSRINEHFGSNVGVRRYINPMSGRWTTEPIVTPYVKLGKSKMEFPIGNILKTLIWGDRDNPMRFRPPVPPPQRK